MGDAIARKRSSDEEIKKESYGGIQGEGSVGRIKGRQGAGSENGAADGREHACML